MHESVYFEMIVQYSKRKNSANCATTLGAVMSGWQIKMNNLNVINPVNYINIIKKEKIKDVQLFPKNNKENNL